MNKLRTLLVALAVAAGGAVAPVTPAHAHGLRLYIVIYYAQDYQTEVGRDIFYCDDHFDHVGGISGYDTAYYLNEC